MPKKAQRRDVPKTQREFDKVKIQADVRGAKLKDLLRLDEEDVQHGVVEDVRGTKLRDLLHLKDKTKTKDVSGGLYSALLAQDLEKTQISKYHTKGGHGFAAEDANNLADRIEGRGAEVIGISQELNGPDRVVDGILVQSKYYQTAAETVSSAFDTTTGKYRYTGQVLEVPKDQYDDCVVLMRKRINQGKVPGYSDPADAEKIVQQGTVTYKQARNIARAGNIDSLVFDAKSQAVTSSYVFAVSFAVTFAHSRWRGGKAQDAIEEALASAISAGSTTLITGIVSAQLLRTKVAALGVVSVRSGIKAISGSTIGRSTINHIAAGSLGKAVYGAAAANHVSKLLRTNAVTATISAVVTSTPDFYRAAFEESISWRQFTKSFAVNIAGVASGTAGWVGGVAVGAAAGSAVPGIGTAVGGVVGGIAGALGGGVGGSAIAKKVADRVVDDDSNLLVEVLQDEVQTLAFEYMLTEKEVEHIASEVQETVDKKWLRRMFKETNKASDDYALREYVRFEFEPKFEAILQTRPRIALPSAEQLEGGISRLVEAGPDQKI